MKNPFTTRSEWKRFLKHHNVLLEGCTNVSMLLMLLLKYEGGQLEFSSELLGTASNLLNDGTGLLVRKEPSGSLLLRLTESVKESQDLRMEGWRPISALSSLVNLGFSPTEQSQTGPS